MTNLTRSSLMPLLILLLVPGCGSRDSEPVHATLSQLAAGADHFDGETVVTTGVVRMHDDPRHYWIEDEALNRVQVVPKEAVAAHVGTHVRVTGRFSPSRETGRRIDVDAIEPIDR